MKNPPPNSAKWAHQIMDALRDVKHAREVFIDMSSSRFDASEAERHQWTCRIQAAQLAIAQDGLKFALQDLLDDGSIGEQW